VEWTGPPDSSRWSPADLSIPRPARSRRMRAPPRKRRVAKRRSLQRREGRSLLPRERPIVSHGLHNLNDGRTRRLRVTPIIHQRCMCSTFDYAVAAVG
jgi:hypothetical protein